VELQNTYGVKMKDEQAARYRQLAEQWNIGISIHAPYYITLASPNREIVARSIDRLHECFALAVALNSERVIFHPGHFPGSCSKSRKDGIQKIVKILNDIRDDLPISNVKIYPEIAGKKNQLGTLDEIIEICECVDYARPCLDLAHLHACMPDGLIEAEDFVKVFDKVERHLGRSTIENCHIHMYPVGVGDHGEDSHMSFDDVEEKSQMAFTFFARNKPTNYFYPQSGPFIDAVFASKINPVIICEAKDTQDIGAILMRDKWESRHEATSSSIEVRQC